MKASRILFFVFTLVGTPTICLADHRGNPPGCHERPWYDSHERHQSYYPHTNRHYSEPISELDRTLYRGYQSGQLSRRERYELRTQEAELNRKRYHYLADGHLSKNEKRDLKHEYRELEHDLAHDLRDSERRF